jgi:hypothetical protein
MSRLSIAIAMYMALTPLQRLAGASLLVFANKHDLQGSMTDIEIRDVRLSLSVTVF